MTTPEAEAALRDYYLDEARAIFETVREIVLAGGDGTQFIEHYANVCASRDVDHANNVRQVFARIKTDTVAPCNN